MHVLISVLIVIVCGVISLYGGVRCGSLMGSRIRTHFLFWCVSALIFCAGVLLSSVAIALQSLALTVFVLGALVGLLVGCKFGYGKNPGIWGMHDRFFLKSDEESTDDPGAGVPRSVAQSGKSTRKPSHGSALSHLRTQSRSPKPSQVKGVTSRCAHKQSGQVSDTANDTSAQELMSVDGRYTQAYQAPQKSSEQES